MTAPDSRRSTADDALWGADAPLSAEQMKAMRRLTEMAVPAALDLLLTEFDICRNLLDLSQSEHRAITAGRRNYGLSVKDRRTLDSTIASFWEDFTGSAEAEVDRITSQAVELGFRPDDDMYPVASEVASGMASIIFQQIKESAIQKHFQIFFDDQRKMDYILSSVRFGPGNRTEMSLCAAILPLIVSKLEEYVAALVRTGLTRYPSALGDLPSIPNEIFQRYQDSFNRSSIERWQLDQKVAGIIKSTPEDWRTTIQRWTKIDIAAIGADWDMLTELIQRRHVITHNGGRADSNYLRNVAKGMTSGLRLGSELRTDSGYLLPVLAELETWAICLACLWTKHFFRSDGIYYDAINHRIVGLENAGRWTQALAVSDAFLTEPISADMEDVGIVRVNRALCLQQLGRDSETLRREIEGWDTNTMGDSGQRVGLARLALLGSETDLLRALRQATEGPDAFAQRRDLKDEPVFKRAMQQSIAIRNFFLNAGKSANPPSRIRRGRGGRRQH